MRSLESLCHSNGVLFDDFLEKKFAWGTDVGDKLAGGEAYTEPWIGVLHNPPNIPDWYNLHSHSPHDVLSSALWRESISRCRGIFVFSKYLKQWLEERISVPVSHLYHPTGKPKKAFSEVEYLKNDAKKVVHIGWWLRKLHTFYELETGGIEKVLLTLDEDWMQPILEHERGLVKDAESLASVSVWPYLDNSNYDALLSKNIVYMDLYDSSANNAVIECIVRATPLLINRLPAVVEYLGEDYPLYFDSKSEAEDKIQDDGLIISSHNYLSQLQIREKFTAKYFRRAISKSRIYRELKHLEPKISILTSAYEADLYIEGFLNDITNQSIFDECELLLFDISSSHRDPTKVRRTISQFEQRFSNIKYLHVSEDPGLYGVWNHAIELSRGRYLTNANIDDRRSSTLLEEQLAVLESEPTLDVVCTTLLATSKPNETWEVNSAHRSFGLRFNWQTEDFSSLGCTEEFGLDDLFLKDDAGRWLDSDNLPHCMPMWRGTIHDRVGFFDESSFGMLADWEFWVRCANSGCRFKLIRKPLGLYLENKDSHNRRGTSEQIKAKIISMYSS